MFTKRNDSIIEMFPISESSDKSSTQPIIMVALHHVVLEINENSKPVTSIFMYTEHGAPKMP